MDYTLSLKNLFLIIFQAHIHLVSEPYSKYTFEILAADWIGLLNLMFLPLGTAINRVPWLYSLIV